MKMLDGSLGSIGLGGKFAKGLALLPVIAIAAAAWVMRPAPSDAEGHPVPLRSAVLRSAQNASWFDPAMIPTQATFTAPMDATLVMPAQATPPGDSNAQPPEISAPETTVPAKPAVDGLKISSQSWRRGGLGSKALMTFTLRNGNDYAVKDIEIACAFARRDGSHLTDRRRVLPDTVNMKSRKRYSGMLVGFVNVYANKAKCALVTASRS